MTLVIANRRGISSLSLVVILLVVVSSASAAYYFTGGFQIFSPGDSSGGSSNSNISSMGDAINDLQKSGNEILEVESPPNTVDTQLVTSYSTFKNMVKKETVYCFVDSTKCFLFIEKDDHIFAWAPQKWEKMKITSARCELQTPGWLIILTVENRGNVPIVISNIYVAGDEIANINFNTENFVPLSASINLKKNTILELGETITFEIRVSNYYKYLKVGSNCEIKICTSSGYTMKKIINFESGK